MVLPKRRKPRAPKLCSYFRNSLSIVKFSGSNELTSLWTMSFLFHLLGVKWLSRRGGGGGREELDNCHVLNLHHELAEHGSKSLANVTTFNARRALYSRSTRSLVLQMRSGAEKVERGVQSDRGLRCGARAGRESDPRAGGGVKSQKHSWGSPQNVKEERGGDTLGETLWIRNKSARALRVLCAGPAAEVVARALGLGPCFRATAPLFRALTPRLSRGWCRRGVSPSHRAQTHHILLTQNLFCAKTAELWKGAESMCYV